MTDDVEEYPAPSSKINTSELVTDDIEEYPAPLQKINTSEITTDEIVEYPLVLVEDPIVDAIPDDQDRWLHRVSGGKLSRMSECGFDDDDWITCKRKANPESGAVQRRSNRTRRQREIVVPQPVVVPRNLSWFLWLQRPSQLSSFVSGQFGSKTLNVSRRQGRHSQFTARLSI